MLNANVTAARCNAATLMFDDPCEERYFQEVVSRLYGEELDALSADLVAYDESRQMTPRMEDILGRVDCLSQADRILRKFEEIPDMAA